MIDPFMGSGTTVFAALTMGRTAVGSDIGALPYSLVTGLLDFAANSDLVVDELLRILEMHDQIASKWFRFDETKLIERTRFDVTGEYAHGQFDLHPVELVLKRLTAAGPSGRWTTSSPEDLKAWDRRSRCIDDYLVFPVDFGSVNLRPNSRIAIPDGARLSHFFTSHNQASINLMRSLLTASPLAPRHISALNLLLSASIPLLRLSDKKASSQWPYWRPRRSLTSRNPMFVYRDRLKQLRKFGDWAVKHLPSDETSSARLLNMPAQEITTDLLGRSVALVLTDPPYGDQVPYGEYGALWDGIMQYGERPDMATKELVRSDAQHRRADSAEYLQRLADAFASNAALLAPGGIMAWFYQDQDLKCWESIHDAASAASMTLLDVIPLPKQRRSLKTVVSPDATLDGDLLCLFAVADDTRTGVFPSEMPDLSAGSYFDRYARLIQWSMSTGAISSIAREHGTVKRALGALGGGNVLATG